MTNDRDLTPPILIDVDPVHGSHSRRTDKSMEEPGRVLDEHTKMPLVEAQKQFLTRSNVNVTKGNAEQAWRNSWKAATQRNKIYKDLVRPLDRMKLQEAAKFQTMQLSKAYAMPVGEITHERNIIALSESISEMFSSILYGDCLRIGTAQKFFNLYLKFLWCFDNIAEPPHCPVDRIVQVKACFSPVISWTKLDTIEEYREVVRKLTAVAGARRPVRMSLAEWELREGW